MLPSRIVIPEPTHHDRAVSWGGRGQTLLARTLVYALIVAGSGACHAAMDRAPIVQPGAPGEASRIIAADRAADLSRVQHTLDDVRFMQRMIAHHAQAIQMVELLPSRTDREDMRLLARRIELSQADEIDFMRQWLRARGAAQPVVSPSPDRHAAHHGAESPDSMPGMLSGDEMSQLSAARGADFERLFLEGMIRHHAGALTMVRELFATSGAGQEVEIFSFASDVEADQRMEIGRMSTMLDELMAARSKEIRPAPLPGGQP